MLPHSLRKDYLSFEAEAEIKHEFWYGQIMDRAGASPRHNVISANLCHGLIGQVRNRGCLVTVADQRVYVPGGNYAYPDVVMVCDDPEYTEDNPPSLQNPTLIIEAVSPSTTDRDRGDKLQAYTQLESLKAYWIVEQDKPMLMQVERHEQEWTLRFVNGLDAMVDSEALDIAMPMRDIYALVSFGPN